MGGWELKPFARLRHKEQRHTMAEKMTRGQIQDLVGKFASENPKYRTALLSNPKATIE